MRLALACLPGLAVGLFGTIVAEAWLMPAGAITPSPRSAHPQGPAHAAQIAREPLAALLQPPLRERPALPNAPPQWAVAGMLESPTPEASRALLRDAAARSCTVVVGGQLEGYAVVEIADRRVVLDRDGHRVVLTAGTAPMLSSPLASVQPFSTLRALVREREPFVFEADRGALQRALGESMGELLVSAQLVPAFEGGRATGLKLVALREGSPLGWLGLQRSDVITSVGGVALTSLDAMLSAMPALQRERVIEVGWSRGGRPMQARLELRDPPR